MFEYHGWVTIRDTAGPEEDPARLTRQIEEIQERLARLGDYGLLDLRWMNGTPFLHLAGNPNRRGAWGQEIIGLFARVGEIAPGSFGLLYVLDDESDEEVRVFRMARGEVTEHADPFLSPVVPTLEDPG
ncbi:Imm7 family immunity protein [Nonomuraea aridisoli]|uniref:Immunity protein 7 n=1 Tax=Nonomuraea aridisoli TaxID=2070368 RepID=A0A2W2DMR0_9ACTN|nr:Imm7 family immunity protein [Nonomuraea aridisoli]PZG13252.1 hypothetical protein C1J01_30570 [Nonomuraea aridisoli]